jgi:hypothetical protein
VGTSDLALTPSDGKTSDRKGRRSAIHFERKRFRINAHAYFKKILP